MMFLLPVFVFFSTGLLLINHECENCGISKVLINKQQAHTHDFCTGEQSRVTCSRSGSCDTGIQKNADCCKDHVFYLKLDQPFVNFTTEFDHKLRPVILFDNHAPDRIHDQMTSQLFYTSLLKPPDFSGKDILRDHCILRI